MADELLQLTDGTNTVNFLSGEGAITGYIKQNIEGLDPPPVEVIYAGREPVDREWQSREISILFSIKASDAADLTDKQNTLVTIMENTYLYWASEEKLGAKAQLQYRRPGGTNISYIDVFSGECDWGKVEAQQAAPYAYVLHGAQLILTCEPCFHPNSNTNLVNAQYFYNHTDAQQALYNYADIAAASIAGDVAAKTKITIEDDNLGLIKFFYLARRSVGTVGNFLHWLEAEDADTQTNWADTAVAETNRSGGNTVTDASNTSGWIRWAITSNPGDLVGRFRIYASLKTDDITNTQFRLTSAWGWWGTATTHQWKKLTHADRWQLIYMGTVDGSAIGPNINRWRIKIEYEKDATDTAKCDYVFLMPEDESALIAHAVYAIDDNDSYADRVVFDGTASFPHCEIQASTGKFSGHLTLQSGYLTLQPGDINRVYFKGLSVASETDVFDDHKDLIGGDQGNPDRVKITIDYLPQYLVPLA